MNADENPNAPPAEPPPQFHRTGRDYLQPARTITERLGFVLLVYFFVIPALPVYSPQGMAIMMSLFGCWAIWYVSPRRKN